MTEQTTTPHRVAGRRSRPGLRRTVPSIAVAALVAAWLPFSILYINALTNHAVSVAKAGRTAQTTGSTAQHQLPITTRVSGVPLP